MKSDEALAAESSLEAKLAEAGADQVRRPTGGFDAAPDPGTPAETVSDDQPRNELGQFAAVDEPETNEVAAPEEPTSEQETVEDPETSAYLAKYGGDVDKAIKAAVHAQKQLGRQSSEVGELRAENAQYEALLEELRGLRGDFQQDRARQPVDQATADWFDQQALENPYGAAEYARQQGNPMLLQRALSTWKEIDPYGASVYTTTLQNQESEARIRAEIQKAQQLPADAQMHMALTNVMARNPEYTQYSELIDQTLQKYPGIAASVRAAAESGDMAQLEAGIEALYTHAERDTLKQIVRTGVTPTETTTTSEVVAPTVSESHEPAAPPTKTDEFRDAFRQEMEQHRRGVFVAE